MQKTGYKEEKQDFVHMRQGTNTVYDTDNRCCKVTRNRYQYCIKNCAKDWHSGSREGSQPFLSYTC